MPTIEHVTISTNVKFTKRTNFVWEFAKMFLALIAVDVVKATDLELIQDLVKVSRTKFLAKLSETFH